MRKLVAKWMVSTLQIVGKLKCHNKDLQGGNMTYLIILVAIVCLVALVITLSLTKAEDTNYSSDRSINNQLIMYIILIPVIALLLVLGWVFLF